jgi:hypothetical protein
MSSTRKVDQFTFAYPVGTLLRVQSSGVIFRVRKHRAFPKTKDRPTSPYYDLEVVDDSLAREAFGDNGPRGEVIHSSLPRDFVESRSYAVPVDEDPHPLSAMELRVQAALHVYQPNGSW